MAAAHNRLATYLGHFLMTQLDLEEYEVRVNFGHIRRSADNYFIPDVSVIPTSLVEQQIDQDDVLETYRDPLPLVVEVWSRSTGRYDLRTKLREYRRRRDHEIWYAHPTQRTLTAWRLQPDGTYVETVFRGGLVQPVALPGVTIDLDNLFRRRQRHAGE
jgi:Uma2 family endonuclease